MAQWPPSGMSNSGFPGFSYRVEILGPPTIKTKFMDGRTITRQKSALILRRIHERWQVNRADMRLLLAVFIEMGLSTKFTKLSLDPQSTVAGFSTDEVIVRFDAQPVIDQVGPNWYHANFIFLESEV